MFLKNDFLGKRKFSKKKKEKQKSAHLNKKITKKNEFN